MIPSVFSSDQISQSVRFGWLADSSELYLLLIRLTHGVGDDDWAEGDCGEASPVAAARVEEVLEDAVVDDGCEGVGVDGLGGGDRLGEVLGEGDEGES